MTASSSEKALLDLAVDEWLTAARDRHGSDLHLREGLPPVMRTARELAPLPWASLTHDDTEILFELLLDAGARATFEACGDATAIIRRAHGPCRVHAYRTQAGTAIAVRILHREAPSLDDLGLPPIVESFASYEHGLVVFAGQTGSGKTTSMAALVDAVNRRRACRIITIEDPVEFVHLPKCAYVEQRQIGSDVTDYEAAVHGALRSDPDLVVIGEVRDCSAARAALQAAETGHLVMTTMHAGSADQAVERLTALFPPDVRAEVRAQLGATLRAVVHQRLLPARNRSSRVPNVEILIANDAVRQLIRTGATHQLRTVMETGRASGMVTAEMHRRGLEARGAIVPDASDRRS